MTFENHNLNHALETQLAASAAEAPVESPLARLEQLYLAAQDCYRSEQAVATALHKIPQEAKA